MTRRVALASFCAPMLALGERMPRVRVARVVEIIDRNERVREDLWGSPEAENVSPAVLDSLAVGYASWSRYLDVPASVESMASFVRFVEKRDPREIVICRYRDKVSGIRAVRELWRARLDVRPRSEALWAEGSEALAQCDIRFRSGPQAHFVTDGWHVAYRTGNGETWFFRFLKG